MSRKLRGFEPERGKQSSGLFSEEGRRPDVRKSRSDFPNPSWRTTFLRVRILIEVNSGRCLKRAPIPQLDRGTDYESVRRGFESLLAHHLSNERLKACGIQRAASSEDSNPRGENNPVDCFLRRAEGPTCENREAIFRIPLGAPLKQRTLENVRNPHHFKTRSQVHHRASC